jgi:CRP/FNR family transcriptional regulator, cyclic AMP receptor protein
MRQRRQVHDAVSARRGRSHRTAAHVTGAPRARRGSLPPFDVRGFLDSAGISRRIVRYARAAVVFAQGGQANSVFYIQQGGVQLSVLSRRGREAVVAMLAPGDFFGEGCLAGQPLRMATATALVPTTVLRIQKRAMMRSLHEQSALSDRFIAHMLVRNIRIEEDLVDQLFDSSEKRLARTLLLLARYGDEASPRRVLPRISQETLAEMVGTTRSQVNVFMNKFRKLGFIKDNGTLTVDSALLSVVLHD